MSDNYKDITETSFCIHSKSYHLYFFFFQEERQKRLGPGGLDPVEVFASLPKVGLKFS